MSTYTPLPGAGGADPALEARVDAIETQVDSEVVPALLDDKRIIDAVSEPAVLTGIEPFELTDVISVGEWEITVSEDGGAATSIPVAAVIDMTVADYLDMIEQSAMASVFEPSLTAALDGDGAITLSWTSASSSAVMLQEIDFGALETIGFLPNQAASGTYTPARQYETVAERIGVGAAPDEKPLSEVLSITGNEAMRETSGYGFFAAPKMFAWHPSVLDANPGDRVIVGAGAFTAGAPAFRVTAYLAAGEPVVFEYTPQVGDTFSGLADQLMVGTDYLISLSLAAAFATDEGTTPDYYMLSDMSGSVTHFTVEDLTAGDLTAALGFPAFAQAVRATRFLTTESIVLANGPDPISLTEILIHLTKRVRDLESRLQTLETP